MSEPIEFEEPDTGEVGEGEAAVAQSEGFLNKALEKAGAERDTGEAPVAERQKAHAAPSAPREKSQAQLRFEERQARRNEARERQMQQQVLAKIAAALEVEEDPETKDGDAEDDPEPDPELDWRAWNGWNQRQIIKAVQAQVAPIQAFFGTLTEQQQRQLEEDRQARAQFQQVEQTRAYLAAETQEYEKFAPGYMDRVQASFAIHYNSLVSAGFSDEEAKREAGSRFMGILSAAGRQGRDPMETLDLFVTNELRSLGYQVQTSAANGNEKPNAEIAQRRAAASAPVAGSLGQGGGPKGSQSAAGGPGGLSREQIIARAKKKYGKDWKANLMKIAGEAALAGVAS